MADNDDLGTITRQDGRFEARLTRHIEHEAGAVWRALTDPARFVDWLAPGSIELSAGGRARLEFEDSGIVIDSPVTAFDEGRLLEYSWGGPDEPERPVRWEIAAEGAVTHLTLTLQIPEDEDIAKACAGWEAHLMMLLAALEGVPIKFPFERYVESRGAYSEMLETATG